MSKHRKEGGHTPRPQLREYFTSSRRRHGATTPGHIRNSIAAAIVATGAFAAVGQPLTANAIGDPEPVVTPLAAGQSLSAAVTGTVHAPASVTLLRPEVQHNSDASVHQLGKVKQRERAREVAQQQRDQQQAAQQQVAQRERTARANAAKAAEAQHAEQRAAQAQRTTSSAEFVQPAEGTFTSGFGARWGSTHKGVDIANSIGTPIHAVTGGEVINAGSASGFGQWIRLRHDDGTISVYGHINTVDVSVGQQVESGEQIATMGNKGQSTGPHLHFEVIQDGSKINPLPWLLDRGIDIR